MTTSVSMIISVPEYEIVSLILLGVRNYQ